MVIDAAKAEKEEAIRAERERAVNKAARAAEKEFHSANGMKNEHPDIVSGRLRQEGMDPDSSDFKSAMDAAKARYQDLGAQQADYAAAARERFMASAEYQNIGRDTAAQSSPQGGATGERPSVARETTPNGASFSGSKHRTTNTSSHDTEQDPKFTRGSSSYYDNGFAQAPGFRGFKPYERTMNGNFGADLRQAFAEVMSFGGSFIALVRISGSIQDYQAQVQANSQALSSLFSVLVENRLSGNDTAYGKIAEAFGRFEKADNLHRLEIKAELAGNTDLASQVKTIREEHFAPAQILSDLADSLRKSDPALAQKVDGIAKDHVAAMAEATRNGGQSSLVTDAGDSGKVVAAMIQAAMKG